MSRASTNGGSHGVPEVDDRTEPRWFGSGKLLAAIAVAAVTLLGTGWAVAEYLQRHVTRAELDKRVAPLEDGAERASERSRHTEDRVLQLEVTLSWLARTAYSTAIQVGAPASPPPAPPVLHRDGGLP